MNDKEYGDWVAKDTGLGLLHAVAIYGILLTLYWTLVG